MATPRRKPVSIDNLIRVQMLRERAIELRTRSLERAADYQEQIEAYDAVLAYINPPKT